MSIYEYDEEKYVNTLKTESYEDGLRRGIEAFILDNLEEYVSEERILAKLVKRFQLTKEEAKRYFEQEKEKLY